MRKQNGLLIAVAIVIMLVPLWLSSGTGFDGTDDQAVAAVQALRPDYQPWFQAYWEPSDAAEKALFAVQALLGAGFIGYFCLTMRRRKAGA